MSRLQNFLSVLILLLVVISMFSIISGNHLDQKNKAIASSISHKSSDNVFNVRPITNIMNKESDLELVLVGDVMLGRTVMKKSYEMNDYLYPFRSVGEQISTADIVFANLENPVIGQCPFTEVSLVFCSTPEMLLGLKYSGINVVNIANNHTGNYGVKGIEETIEYLDSSEINYTGNGELKVIVLKGIRLGFLGFNYVYGYNAVNIEKDLQLINKSSKEVDHLLIGVHWGYEYRSIPNEFQKDMAIKMIEAGADVISGHHPHWIQTYEFINDKPVFYSLGNFVFDQMWSEQTRTGLVAYLDVNKDSISVQETRKVYMNNWAQPEFLAATE